MKLLLTATLACAICAPAAFAADSPWNGTWKLDAGRSSPGVQDQAAAIIRILPSIGAVRFLKFHGPGSKAEQLYIQSVDRTLDVYCRPLAQLRLLPEVPIDLPNRDLDTGDWTRPGEYALTDSTYAKLLRSLTADRQRMVPTGLQ